jgi:[ribosomal protein S18]-alanine N-acetyltransferase
MSEKNQIYRELKYEDLDECIKIVESLEQHYEHPIGGDWTPDKVKSELIDHQGVAYTTAEGVIDAFCLYRDMGDVCEIMLLATQPRIHRTGAMKALIRSLIEDLGKSKTIWLEVHAGNIPAISLYESLGFRLTGERPHYYSDGGKALMYEFRDINKI